MNLKTVVSAVILISLTMYLNKVNKYHIYCTTYTKISTDNLTIYVFIIHTITICLYTPLYKLTLSFLFLQICSRK